MEEMETTSPAPRRHRSRDNRYRMLEKYRTYALLGDAGVFVLYLISAGFGIGWLKAFSPWWASWARPWAWCTCILRENCCGPEASG